MSGMYSDMERERAALYERFEETIEAVKKRSEFRNLLLEKRLADLQADYEARQTTLSEVRACICVAHGVWWKPRPTWSACRVLACLLAVADVVSVLVLFCECEATL